VVLTELLKERQRLPKPDTGIDVFFLVEEETWRTGSLRLIQALRDAGLTVDYPLVATKSDKQFKRALELKARYTARLEASTGDPPLVRLKHLQTREEQLVPSQDLPVLLRAKP
jgi:histidyl-tRNA synthetase